MLQKKFTEYKYLNYSLDRSYSYFINFLIALFVFVLTFVYRDNYKELILFPLFSLIIGYSWINIYFLEKNFFKKRGISISFGFGGRDCLYTDWFMDVKNAFLRHFLNLLAMLLVNFLVLLSFLLVIVVEYFIFYEIYKIIN